MGVRVWAGAAGRSRAAIAIAARRRSLSASAQRFPVEVLGKGHAEEVQDGGGEVHDVGRLVRDLPRGEEHPAADLGGGGAMVAAPLAVVVFHEGALHPAHGVLPAHAIAVVEAHLQVGSVAQVFALVDVVALVDGPEDLRLVVGIQLLRERFPDLLLEGIVLGARRDDAAALPALQIEVDLPETHRVGAGARPVDALPELAAAEQIVEPLLGTGLAVEDHVAVLDQPGIEIDPATEGVEAVIGHHHERGVLREFLLDLPHQRVCAAIDLLDGVAVLRGEDLVVHGVFGIDQAEEHVGDPVGGFDRGHEEIPVVVLQVLENDLLAIVEGLVRVVEERSLIGPSFLERLVHGLGQPMVR